MSESSTSTEQCPIKTYSTYFSKKIFRLFGLVPLGIYVLVHLYNNNISNQGPEAFNAHLQWWRERPFKLPLTVLFLYIPLFWHLFYGIYVASQTRPNNTSYSYFSNFRYLLQRLSGIGLALFIPAHIVKTRIEPFFEHETVDFNHMAQAFTENLTLGVYALGILGVSYHIANGFWEAGVSWGWTVSRRSQRTMVGLSMLVFFAVALLGGSAVRGFMVSGH